MLRANLWTPTGLTNGAIGEFISLVAPETGRMPLAALVRFPSYSGPAFFEDDPKLVPVPPYTAHFGGSGNALSRTQLPLQLAWAITIHKSQGQTYDKATINLGTKELQLGMYLILALCQMHDFDCGFKTCASVVVVVVGYSIAGICQQCLEGLVGLATCSGLILNNA